MWKKWRCPKARNHRGRHLCQHAARLHFSSFHRQPAQVLLFLQSVSDSDKTQSCWDSDKTGQTTTDSSASIIIHQFSSAELQFSTVRIGFVFCLVLFSSFNVVCSLDLSGFIASQNLLENLSRNLFRLFLLRKKYRHDFYSVSSKLCSTVPCLWYAIKFLCGYSALFFIAISCSITRKANDLWKSNMRYLVQNLITRWVLWCE